MRKVRISVPFLSALTSVAARVGLCALLLTAVSESAGQEVQYNRDVRPILSNNCFFCHGFDSEKREAGLRLDTLEGAIDGGAIEPGDPDSSTLIDRIFSDDSELLMPPANSAYSLTDNQKDVLKRWIEQGANYEQHWAYQKVVKPEVPENGNAHPIDAFLSRRWKSEDVQPVAAATPRHLIRRLSYDLRGLPPSVQEVQRFQSDPSESRYRELIQRWSQSTEYGEHQGLIWLDLVRWADTTGMVSDEPIATGAYRAYVIKAFQDNMPFDQFTREQLAGDLLPEVDDRTLIASGYNRLVKTNCEAGVIEKEALHALKGEHVRAVGTVWLGATTGCAECHDHKYDPITAKDYYSLAAFFDDLVEIGVYDPGDRRFPVRYLYDNPESRRQDDQLREKIRQLRSEIYEADFSDEALSAWEAETLSAYRKLKGRDDWAWIPAELPPARITTGEYRQTDTGRVVTAEDGQLALHSASEVMTGYTEKISDKDSELYLEVSLDSENPPAAIGVKVIHGDYQRQGWKDDYFTTYFWGDPEHSAKFKTTVADASRIVHVGALPDAGELAHLVLPKKKIKTSPHEPVGLAWIQIGGTVTWGASGFRLAAKNAFAARLAESTNRYWWHLPWNRDDRDDRMRLVVDALEIKTDQRRTIHRDVIKFAFQESRHKDQVHQLQDEYRQLERVRQHATDQALVSEVGPLKETKLRDRGNFMDEEGARLNPAVPEFLALDKFLQTDERLDRLDLANWLVDPDNPLTARVFVNRLWHQFYGRGISETLEDAGNQGDWPSHPDLLNWLAAEFVQSGWDVRKMVELMVTSKAYRMSSVPSKKMAEMDPTNRLHSRQGRPRLQAEEIRDSALLVAGMLQPTREIPTRSFFPYQPHAYWAKSSKIMFGSRHLIWETNQGASQYQRSLYTFWKRQNAHPSMLAFDAPTRQECTARRPTTNTPGQALALLNDTIFVEAARALAESVLTDPSATEQQQRIELVFQKLLQRQPSAEEAELIAKALAAFQLHYGDDSAAAKKLLSVGQWKSAELPPVEFAAWTATCRMILNLHEFITRS